MREQGTGLYKDLQYNLPKLLFILGLIAFIILGKAHNRAVVFAHSDHTQITIKYGKVRGYEDTNNTLAWKGIPYAKPPVGELRWQAPQDPDSWKGILDATIDCEPCTQLYTLPSWIRLPWAVGSEDCLYLNIWRPHSDDKELPVYVWIHGGSNNFGEAADYNASVLASKSNMVVVVIQYRLGPLGWFAHPALRTGDPLDDSGNFGTLDTIKALEWVHDNIKHFGGDPKNVTVAGESAGAHNVMNLVISPLAAGLFHKAMSQSGGMTTVTVAEGEAQAEATIAALLAAEEPPLIQVPDMDEDGDVDDDDTELYLRSKGAGEIFEALYGSLPSYDAYQDGHILPGSVVATIRSGNYNKVPIILGANEYETKAFLPLYGPYLGVPWWWALRVEVLDLEIPLDNVLPTDFDKLLYEVTGYYGSRNWRAKFVDERARALKEQQDKVYAYLFKWGGDSTIGSGPSPFDFIYGAGHAMEIPFFFGSDTSLWGYSFGPGYDYDGRVELQDAMMAYVAAFARTGNPNKNKSGLPGWEQWSNDAGGPKVIEFDADFDYALIGMSDEELTIPNVWAELAAEIATWDPSNQDSWGWLPWSFQWETPE